MKMFKRLDKLAGGKDFFFAVFIVSFAFVFLTSGANPYFSFLNYATNSVMLEVGDFNITQPIDHPVFQPGLIQTSPINILRGDNMYYTYYYQYDGDKGPMLNFLRAGSDHVAAFLYLNKSDGSSILIDSLYGDLAVSNPSQQDGCTDHSYDGSSSYYNYRTCPVGPLSFGSVDLTINESGLYNLNVVTLTGSSKDIEKIQANPDGVYQRVNPVGYIYYLHYHNPDSGYDEVWRKCVNESVSPVVDDVIDPSAIVELRSTGYNIGEGNTSCSSFNLTDVSDFCQSAVDDYTFSNAHKQRCGVWMLSTETISFEDNKSLEKEFVFEVKPDIDVLQEQLIELRGENDVVIDELFEKLGDENMTADELKAAMEDYRALLENKTDARLVEKLILLRYEFEYKMRQLEGKGEDTSDLEQQWAETIPLLELDIQALQEKQSLINDKLSDLEEKYNLLLESGDLEGSNEISNQMTILEQEKVVLDNALKRIGWETLPQATKTSVLLSLGSLGLFVLRKRKFYKW